MTLEGTYVLFIILSIQLINQEYSDIWHSQYLTTVDYPNCFRPDFNDTGKGILFLFLSLSLFPLPLSLSLSHLYEQIKQFD